MANDSLPPPDSPELKTIESLKLKQRHIVQRLSTFQFTWWGWLLSILFGIVVSIMLPGESRKIANQSDLVAFYVPRILVGVVLGPFCYAYMFGAFRIMLSSRLRRIEVDLVNLGADELKETIEENFFTKLVQINFKYLDQYYLQTQEQANKSFALASFAAIVGLVIVIVGIVMMFNRQTEPAYVTTGAGVLSQFIAAIFFYLYNKTILKMSQYHQKLVITQNISLALKITDGMQEEQKAESLEVLVDRLTTDANKYLTGMNE